jgi:hypothetical protein
MNSDSLVVQPVASRYTDYGILGGTKLICIYYLEEIQFLNFKSRVGRLLEL